MPDSRTKPGEYPAKIGGAQLSPVAYRDDRGWLYLHPCIQEIILPNNAGHSHLNGSYADGHSPPEPADNQGLSADNDNPDTNDPFREGRLRSAHLGRLADRHQRRLKKTSDLTPYEIEKQVASQFNLQVTQMRALVSLHRQKRNSRIEKFRKQKFKRLFLEDMRLRDIANEINVHERTLGSWKKELLAELRSVAP